MLLRGGEIQIETAADPRPFEVRTRDGTLRALGTRFTVRQQDDHARLAVQEGAVRITTGQDQRVLPAGEQADFSARGIDSAPLSPASGAWLQGMLLADAMPLGEVVAELDVYKRQIGSSSRSGISGPSGRSGACPDWRKAARSIS